MRSRRVTARRPARSSARSETTETTEVDVIGFGYNEDTSDTGSGTFTVTADVSALKVG